MGPSCLPVRSTDLDHGDAGTAQEAGQAGTVGAGALDTDPIKRAEAAQPGVQLAEPGGRRWERPDAKQPAIAVHGGGDMSVEVGVHPTSDLTCLYDGHGHPFFCSSGLTLIGHENPGDGSTVIVSG